MNPPALKPTPGLTPVKSSNLAAVGFNPAARRLTVRFKDGAEHHYENVPAEVYRDLMKAESKGGFLHRRILQKPKLFRAVPGYKPPKK